MCVVVGLVFGFYIAKLNSCSIPKFRVGIGLERVEGWLAVGVVVNRFAMVCGLFQIYRDRMWLQD